METTQVTLAIEMNVSGEKIVSAKFDFVGLVANGNKVQFGSSILNVVDDKFLYDRKHSIDYKDLIGSHILLRQMNDFENFLLCLQWGRKKVSGKIAILEGIKLYPEYRGMGLFKDFMSLVLKALKENLDVDYIFLKPYPFELDMNDNKAFLKELQHLENVYYRFGFRKYQIRELLKDKHKALVNYMYLKLTDRHLAEFGI